MNKLAIKYKPLTFDLAKKARILELAGDETRIRVLCVLFDRRDVCVSDMAQALQMSIASISHHLQLLQDNGLVSSRREGKNICYSLKDSPLINHIKKFVCYKGR